MQLILGLILLSFFTISLLLVPFINLLYKIKFQRQTQKTIDIFARRTPIFDKLHAHKVGTPLGGGFLVIFVVFVLTLFFIFYLQYAGLNIVSIYPFEKEIFILLFTFTSFGLLGLYDDLRKTFGLKAKFWGLKFWHKLILQIILAVVIAWWLYSDTGLGIHILNIRFIDVFDIGAAFLPFAAFVIIAFANAVNITDGLDGLATGTLVIALVSFLAISANILDTTLSIFLGLWIGALIAFLYFNIPPARIWLGDVGALSFGATLAVVGLLTGKILALAIIGGVFVVEVGSSAIQLFSKKFFGKKVFEVAPLHLWFQNRGWEEPKIVIRFWLAAVMFSVFGLWLAFGQ